MELPICFFQVCLTVQRIGLPVFSETWQLSVFTLSLPYDTRIIDKNDYIHQGMQSEENRFSFIKQLSVFQVHHLAVKSNALVCKRISCILGRDLSPRESCLLLFFFLKFQLSTIVFLSNRQMFILLVSLSKRLVLVFGAAAQAGKE